jgi:hypothetical protein
MPYYKFKDGNLLNNTLEVHPAYNFFFYTDLVYLDQRPEISGNWVNNAGMVPVGNVSLYEMNVDRPRKSEWGPASLVYPFITKDGSQGAFRTVSSNTFNSTYAYGDVISASYPMSATLSKNFYALNASRKQVKATMEIWCK